jgi:hypothetical protein
MSSSVLFCDVCFGFPVGTTLLLVYDLYDTHAFFWSLLLWTGLDWINLIPWHWGWFVCFGKGTGTGTGTGNVKRRAQID